MTIEKLITDHIDIWSSALQTRSTAGRGSTGKIDLYGIKKLRELILELAVRGKLVPQDPNDEPASELLKRIAAEKAVLVKQGTIKKQKPLPEVSENEKPFELPEKWEWVRLGELGYTQTGGTPSKSNIEYFGNDIPFIKPGDITAQGVIYNNEGLSIKGAQNLGRIAPSGSILMVCIGTIGKCQIINRTCSFNQQINSITTFVDISDFIYLVVSSSYFQSLAWSYSSSTTIAILNKGKWGSLMVPVAPLSEQARIITNVKELMSLCDQLEQQSLISLDAHQQLVENLLETLTGSKNDEELTENWSRISQHFDTLFTTEASIDALKQTILQLAVMGKLVPQDPNDEPASELLKHIEQEKAQLVKEGIIKKQKPLAPICEDKKSVVLPQGWVQARVDNIFNIIVDCPHSTAKFEERGVLCLDTNTFKDGKLINKKFRFVSNDTYKERISRLEPLSGDIVFAREGSVGESVVIPDNLKCCLGQRVMLLRPSSKMNSGLLRYLLSSKQTLEELLSLHKGIGAKHVNVKDIKNHVIALPPVNEQGRILVKINELYVLCEQLKTRLQSAQQTQLHLADALTEAALN